MSAANDHPAVQNAKETVLNGKMPNCPHTIRC